MKKSILLPRILALSITFFLMAIPFFFANAQFQQTQGGGFQQTDSIPLRNPLTGVNSLGELAIKILDAVVEVGAYVAVIFIIYSGFLFVKAQGNPTEIETAKKTFFYTIIGVMILLGASAIAKAVGNTIRAITV
ncbi:MAG: hypothetical protein A2648_02985 [Candidatus Lloydbacteria bacterium RIFCSPHIGHO2_01_FULL_41_20]|uniref:Uncharacterized protein n=1 Tax=Candidatus Lloydbacteria bacterium RIFCSPHIGHO2_01_FULL_41_20 TaxID=1798657 RepID=A0A1G2CTP6_9BACT|nr:MAG: hypothetical protein A2648_02985 [Candidatus Lloydbacteria bacterium RIFCSPHIGHO2_01_FULL_41_20]